MIVIIIHANNYFYFQALRTMFQICYVGWRSHSAGRPGWLLVLLEISSRPFFTWFLFPARWLCPALESQNTCRPCWVWLTRFILIIIHGHYPTQSRSKTYISLPFLSWITAVIPCLQPHNHHFSMPKSSAHWRYIMNSDEYWNYVVINVLFTFL